MLAEAGCPWLTEQCILADRELMCVVHNRNKHLKCITSTDLLNGTLFRIYPYLLSETEYALVK